jgi:hypothetical protein
MSPKVLGRILSGQIVVWNDPALVLLNPALSTILSPITVVRTLNASQAEQIALVRRGFHSLCCALDPAAFPACHLVIFLLLTATLVDGNRRSLLPCFLALGLSFFLLSLSLSLSLLLSLSFFLSLSISLASLSPQMALSDFGEWAPSACSACPTSGSLAASPSRMFVAKSETLIDALIYSTPYTMGLIDYLGTPAATVASFVNRAGVATTPTSANLQACASDATIPTDLQAVSGYLYVDRSTHLNAPGLMGGRREGGRDE